MPEYIKAPDPEGFDRSGLETATASAMAAVFQDGDDEVVETPAAPAEKVVEETPETPAVEVEEKTPEKEEEVKEEESATSEQEKTPTLAAKPVTTLPAAYIRSLKAYDWTDEEIANASKADPTGFTKMAERVHAQRVKQTQEWANLGRQAKQTAAPAKVEETPKFTPVDEKALRAKYGNEPFIDQMVAQSKHLEYLQNHALPFIEQSRARQQEAEAASLKNQVEGFFGHKDMEPYHDHYGKTGATLTDAQIAARVKVLETADLLVSGARSTGRPITLDEAMSMAHDAVSSPVAAKAAVAKVKTAVQQRQASISVRPGSRAGTPRTGNDRSALEGTVRKGLAAAFK